MAQVLTVEKIEPLGAWEDQIAPELCQCYRPYRITRPDRSKEERMLYCRWKWDDPWTYSTYAASPKGEGWTDLGEGLTREAPIEEVHALAERLLYEHYGLSQTGG